MSMQEEILDKKVKKREESRQLNEAPKRSVLEEVGNAVTHGIGAGLAIAALVLMLVKADGAREYVSCSIYGACGIIMMLMSCLYHSFKSGSRAKRVFRRFDYASIYLLIGGTFAPIYFVVMANTLGLVLFILQWVLIAFGITIVSVFGPGKLRWLHTTLYLVLGWSGLMLMPPLIRYSGWLFTWILVGGLVYTIGIIPFCMKSKSAHFIWHFFVLGGAIIQWFGIFFCIL